MPGFVDVSNMSDLEIKRLGQQDDDLQTNPYAHRNLSRRNPYGYNRRSYTKSEAMHYSADLIWAAAAAAQRVNGDYVKETHSVFDASGTPTGQRRRNRDIMMDFVHAPDTLTAEDYKAGAECRQFLQNDLTFRALKGRLTDFDQSVSRVLAVSDTFDSNQHRLELAVVACLPSSVQRSQKRQVQDERVKFSQGGLIGQPGAKITAQIEVLGSSFSQNYNCWFIKGITDKDQPVFFSYRQGHDVGTWLTIQGTVKAHRDNQTQLNRVRVL